ncbi:hypothetical protein [Sporosarcina sp. UB5]|uniref:hypothetical protein n=1 Tax=Sporosarcina sp. UB5 TaxID=3047463 RepID=UPI003D7B98C1
MEIVVESFSSVKIIRLDDTVVEFKTPGYFFTTDKYESEMSIVFYDGVPLQFIQERDSVYVIHFANEWDDIAFDVKEFNFYVDDYPSIKLVVD